MNSIFFNNSNLVFNVLEQSMSEEEVKNVVLLDFSGKKDFVDFYLTHNGVYFPEGAEIIRSEFYKLNEGDFNQLQVEVIYDIGRLQDFGELPELASSNMKAFAKKHILFAGDAAGNEFWIEEKTGFVKYIVSEYGIPDGEILAAPSFKDFCLAISPLSQ